MLLEMKTIAVILAGGKGSRLGKDLPKQFQKVAGKKIIEHTIEVFERNLNIDEIAIVVKEEFISEVEKIVTDYISLLLNKEDPIIIDDIDSDEEDTMS